MKTYLQRLQKIFPYIWIEQLQCMHFNLLSTWIRLRRTQLLTFNQKSAMVFSPHPDDETFGCGGMIAYKREHGIPVIVVFLTDGQGSVVSVPDAENNIVQIREQEAREALAILGVEAQNIHFLSQLDGSLQDLNYENKQQIISQLAELIQHYQPEEVYVPHQKDSHRDHEATYQLVKTAVAQTNIRVELLQYPIWLFWRAPLFLLLKLEDIAAAYCCSIASVQDKKARAIACYKSQTQNLPRGFIDGFSVSYEIFFKVE